ncbi:MAG: DUF1643 domain-containing protein [Phycisphaerales bacterium]
MSAVFSRCGRFRYRLERILDPHASATVAWVMLNPSTADATTDDQTIRRVRAFSASACESVARVVVVNLYGYRATRPADLARAEDPEGPQNTMHVARAIESADRVIVGWGASVARWRRDRPSAVLGLLAGRELWCLGASRGGDPLHPLRIPGDRPFERWVPS